jgi:hypothetical protein
MGKERTGFIVERNGRLVGRIDYHPLAFGDNQTIFWRWKRKGGLK